MRGLERRLARLERASAPQMAAPTLTDQQRLAVLRALRMKAELGTECGEDGYAELARCTGLNKPAIEARIAELEERVKHAQ